MSEKKISTRTVLLGAYRQESRMSEKASSPTEKTRAETGGQTPPPLPSLPGLEHETASLLGNQATGRLLHGSLGFVQPKLRIVQRQAEESAPASEASQEPAAESAPAPEAAPAEPGSEAATQEASSSSTLIVEDGMEAGPGQIAVVVSIRAFSGHHRHRTPRC